MVEGLAQASSREAIQRALSSLPPEQLEPIGLAYFEGLTHVEIAKRLWDGFPFGDLRFVQSNILADSYYFDVVIMFSTWSYIVQDFGRNKAEEVLRRIIVQAGTFFFENQLAGDGPGPAFFPDDDAIRGTLYRLGARAVKDIGTFPVTGRPASRTVWQVQS